MALLIRNAPGQLLNAKLSLGIDFTTSPLIVAAGYATMGMSVKSFKEPLKRAIKEVVIPSIRRNFDVGGRPKWVPLSPATVAIREKLHTSWSREGSLLVRSGALKRTATQQNIWTIDAEKAYVRTMPGKVWYGIVHQNGSMSGAAHIPERPFMLIQPEDEKEIEEVFDDWLAERMRAAGWKVANV